MPALRVYVNAKGLDVPSDASALDAVRLADPAAAIEIERGDSLLADSRGLPMDPARPAHGGAIYRIIPARKRESALPTDG
jgi:hypothetical protein